MRNIGLSLLAVVMVVFAGPQVFANGHALSRSEQLDLQINEAWKSLESYRANREMRPDTFNKYKNTLIKLYAQKTLEYQEYQEVLSKIDFDQKAMKIARQRLKIDMKLDTLEGLLAEIIHQRVLADKYSNVEDDKMRFSIITDNLIWLNLKLSIRIHGLQF